MHLRSEKRYLRCCNIKVIDLFLEYFQMGKLHKEIAVSLVDAANDEDTTEQAIIKVYRNILCQLLSPQIFQEKILDN